MSPAKIDTLLSMWCRIKMLKSAYKNDGCLEAGIDEAGRGCFWGPMIAAAVIWPEEATWCDELRRLSAGIKDSKKVAPKRRGILEAAIKLNAVAWAIGRVESDEIDQIGMTAANRLAFLRAFEGLSVKPVRLLIDGCLYMKDVDGVEQIVETKADGVYIAVAAASILAKEEHDRIVMDCVAADAALEENYSIGSSKGYGTSKHCAGLLKHGVYAGHRRLFLRNLLGAAIYNRPDSEGCLID